jgi:hypothetical protein
MTCCPSGSPWECNVFILADKKWRKLKKEKESVWKYSVTIEEVPEEEEELSKMRGEVNRKYSDVSTVAVENLQKTGYLRSIMNIYQFLKRRSLRECHCKSLGIMGLN